MMTKKFDVLLIIVLLMGLTSSAYAAGTEEVSNIIQGVFQQAGSLVSAAPLLDTGKKLMYILLSILISWKAVKILLDVSGMNQIIAEIVQIILLAGIAGFFMMPATQTQVASGFDQIAAEMASKTGGSIDVTNPTSAIASTMAKTFEAAEKLWDGPHATTAPSGVDKSLWEKTTGFLKDPMGSTGELLLALAALLYRLFIALFIVAAGLLYMVNLVMSQIMVNIGLILAPIFVPWILWDATAFLFHGWLKFMIVTGIQKVVGALMFGMTANMVAGVTSIASQGAESAALNFYAYSAAFLVVGIMAIMMMSVTSIANGLVSGMPNARFEAPKAMTPGGMAGRSGGGTTGTQMAAGGKAALGGMGGSMGGAIGGIKAGSGAGGKAWGGVSGAYQGGKDGFKGFPKATKP